MGPGRLVHDGRFRRPPGDLADEHLAGRRHGLDAGRRVHEVPRHHALPLGVQRDRGLAGQDARPGIELRRAHLLAQRLDGGQQVQGGADGPFGVVLLRDRRAPHGHHGVADELLHGAAVQGDQPAAGLEVAGQQVADLLRVAGLGEGGEPDQVGEQHRDQPALGRRCLTDGGFGGLRLEGRAALPAEPEPRRHLGSAVRAGAGQRPAARATEPEPLGILLAAMRTAHHQAARVPRNEVSDPSGSDSQVHDRVELRTRARLVIQTGEPMASSGCAVR